MKKRKTQNPDVKQWLARLNASVDELRIEREALSKFYNSPDWLSCVAGGMTTKRFRAAVHKAIAKTSP